MAKSSRDKVAKAALIAKIWQSMQYSSSSLNCGNCSFGDIHFSEGDDDSGECSFLGKEMLFPIKGQGICKNHSWFKHE